MTDKSPACTRVRPTSNIPRAGVPSSLSPLKCDDWTRLHYKLWIKTKFTTNNNRVKAWLKVSVQVGHVVSRLEVITARTPCLPSRLPDFARLSLRYCQHSDLIIVPQLCPEHGVHYRKDIPLQYRLVVSPFHLSLWSRRIQTVLSSLRRNVAAERSRHCCDISVRVRIQENLIYAKTTPASHNICVTRAEI